MIRTLLPLALLFVGTASAADPRTELKALSGTWTVKEAEIDGKSVLQAFQGISLTLDGETYLVKVGEAIDKGTISVDPGKSPKAMDITGTEGVNRGKVFPCLYELKDDTLTVCYGLDFKTRPTDLTTGKDSQRMKIVYTRKK